MRNWVDQPKVDLSMGIEIWQMILIGVGCIFVSMVIGCTLTKFLLRLGIPNFKPYVVNNDYYPEERQLSVQPRKDLMMTN
jgi:nucleoside recognition membrane protein YjiH